MQNKIIIRKKDYLTITEEEYIDKLKIEYLVTSFSTYDPSKEYLHIQVGDYNDFNFYLELDTIQAKKLIKELEKQI